MNKVNWKINDIWLAKWIRCRCVCLYSVGGQSPGYLTNYNLFLRKWLYIYPTCSTCNQRWETNDHKKMSETNSRRGRRSIFIGKFKDKKGPQAAKLFWHFMLILHTIYSLIHQLFQELSSRNHENRSTDKSTQIYFHWVMLLSHSCMSLNTKALFKFYRMTDDNLLLKHASAVSVDFSLQIVNNLH